MDRPVYRRRFQILTQFGHRLGYICIRRRNERWGWSLVKR